MLLKAADKNLKLKDLFYISAPAVQTTADEIYRTGPDQPSVQWISHIFLRAKAARLWQ
jgi:hypothetical protein